MGGLAGPAADELYPVIENLLDELDRWLSVSGPSPIFEDTGFIPASQAPLTD
jgi:hypothetical protein